MQAERDDFVNSHSGPGVGGTHETDSVVNEPTSRYTFYTSEYGSVFRPRVCDKKVSKIKNFIKTTQFSS